MPYRVFQTPPEGKTCPVCGALVSKPKKHRRWHKKNRPIPGPPGPQGPAGAMGPMGPDMMRPLA